MSNSFIWPADRILSGATTPGQSRPESNSNEELFYIPQSSRTVASPSDSLVLYPGLSLRGGSYSYAEMQTVCSTVAAHWAVLVTESWYIKGGS